MPPTCPLYHAAQGLVSPHSASELTSNEETINGWGLESQLTHIENLFLVVHI